VDDDDERLIAGSADIRTLSATRIGEPRYISTLVTGGEAR